MRHNFDSEKKPYSQLIVLAAVLFLVLVAKLVELQLVKSEYYREMSSNNHIRSVIRPAPRGVIVDRNGEVLADNLPSFSVFVIGVEFDSLNTPLLAELLDMDLQTLQERLAVAGETPYKSTQIASGLSLEQAGPVADNLYRLGGVSVDVFPRRRYHHSLSNCHLVGYVGLSDTARVFEGEITGRTGLERLLNQSLSGTNGVIREIVDARGRIVEQLPASNIEPLPGEDVKLTIDGRIQYAADSLIASTGFPGAAVVINYRTGEILALSSVPGFDTNKFIGGISATDWNNILNDPQKPLLNRSWSVTYPPGSVFKIVIAAWLLESGLVDENTMPDPCYGVFNYAGTDFRCWGVHGRLNVVGAIAQSCDTYFYRTSMNGDIDDMADFVKGFGFGAPVTDFLPAEASGMVPSREVLNDLFGRGGWGTGNLMIASIGQGEVLVTPLQVAVATALVASGGTLPPLSLIEGRDSSYRPWNTETSEETFRVVREGMAEAVASSKGTLHSSLSHLPVQVFAKSGTAENESRNNHAWVCGYTEEPIPVAFAVVVENGGHGGAVAGPVAAGIVQKIVEEYSEAD